jgi:immune inhibitor A
MSHYDYAFVTVSTDGGAHWATLKGETTTDDDPQGLNYGSGLNGVSGAPGAETDTTTRAQWVEERMDLSPYAGKKILLRFWVITDDGTNAEGLLIDNTRIPELAYQDGGESGDGGWQAQGFVRMTGVLPQTWELRLIRSGNGRTTVVSVATDDQGRANIQLAVPRPACWQRSPRSTSQPNQPSISAR